MILRIDHIGVVARSFEEAKDILIDTLGFEFDYSRIADPKGYLMKPENAYIHFIRVGEGDTMIELLLPRDKVTGMGRWLDRRGPSVHHVAYMVDDLETHAAELRDKGLEQIDMGPDAGAAFFYPRSTMGILMELVDAKTGERLHNETAPAAALDPYEGEHSAEPGSPAAAPPQPHSHGTTRHAHSFGGQDHHHL
ncbi:MAG: VOC family protein [Acidimicrobiia bacterium]